ncbi:uncharacterized protein BCR38DRAFT_173314 [Pseudomassariella vexata]|uniref:Sialidase n=1 Tax=Pseudomassariella vexata TaxID=1141098 RepID=A0A1Y2E3M6_9PEZI|nr:uncharacterized protein BCR38DRAFT_173314 [Pseudomassariella vexata]ORY66122.1 hypothetical protein BCR38DRAFT_173314 [Pseudomassariella vexata]
MASLVADMSSFDFTFPSCEPVTPPSFTFDPSLLEISYNPGHARSSSYGSVYSTTETSPSNSVSTRVSTPSRSPPPIRQHGPILLPKIRSQDQAIDCSPAKRVKRSPKPAATAKSSRQGGYCTSHTRSFTNPETLNHFSNSFFAPSEDQNALCQSLLCSPVVFPQDDPHSRRASTCSLDGSSLEKFGFPTYRQMPNYVPAVSQEQFMYTQYATRAPSPLSMASTPDPTPSTTLMTYLTSSNPAPSLVRTISFPMRDPNTKHFWWDVRQIRPWTAFNASTILSLPGASTLLNCPVPAPLLQQPPISSRHPETEAALHSIYTSYYVPKLNAALALSSQRPLQLNASTSKTASPNDHVFTANVAGESASAAAMFGGKPTARVVGLVKSFDRFNTGMRVEGNIKRVEYLRGLAHLHHVMREHGCRYGFILTEIELVVVRNGGEGVPHFGYLEVGSVQLGASADDDENEEHMPLTACLALWGLCMMALDKAAPGHAHWKAEIGAPAEGTRRKALPRDEWMPLPQLAEKREAKRARGWVLPEDAVGRKELGKRGVRYGSC